jgi:chemotaxis protein CheX
MSSPAPAQSPAVTHLVEATQEVFGTMVMATLTTGVPIDGDALRPRSNVVGTVSFAGSQSGVVAFYSTMTTAEAIASALLGGPVNDRDQVADAVGEPTNMIAGTFRNHMARDGSAWAISIPTVTVGSDFYTRYVSDVRRTLCPFRMDDEEIFVELILMRGAHAGAR